MSGAKQPNYRIQVIDRTVGILDALASRQGECSLSELSAEVALHKSTVHRILMALEHHRVVRKNPATAGYRLGLKLFELGSSAIAAAGLREHARPYLSRLAADTGETVHLCLLDETDVVYLEKLDPPAGARMSSSVGQRCPAYSTSLGKAILAHLPAEDVDRVIRDTGLRRRTPRTITAPALLQAELRATRSRGYAMDDEENEAGVRCVGAALVVHPGGPIAAISVSGKTSQMTSNKLFAISRSVTETAQRLSSQLGHGVGSFRRPGT